MRKKGCCFNYKSTDTHDPLSCITVCRGTLAKKKW